MTRPATPTVLSKLRNASSPSTQVQALRELKNEIIGHDEKKEFWVRAGVVATLTRIWNSCKGDEKQKSRGIDGTSGLTDSRPPRSVEEEIRLQAIIIIGSLALCRSSVFTNRDVLGQ